MVPLRRAVRSFARDSGGQGLVEFALLIPIFALIFVGMVEFARALNAYQVLTDVAREATRNAVVANGGVTADSVRAIVRRRLQAGALDPEAATVTLVGVDGASGTPARVRIQYPYRFTLLGPFSGGRFGLSSLNLVGEAVMRNE